VIYETRELCSSEDSLHPGFTHKRAPKSLVGAPVDIILDKSKYCSVFDEKPAATSAHVNLK